MTTYGEITPPAGMGGEPDPAPQGDPQGQGGPDPGGQPQAPTQDPGGAAPSPQGGQPPADDPLVQFRLPDGQLDPNALAAAYTKSMEKSEGMEKILANKVAEMNQYVQAPPPQGYQQAPQQAPRNPYEEFLAGLPQDSAYTPEEYQRQARLIEIAASQGISQVLQHMTMQAQQQEQVQQAQAYDTAVAQVRNQFATYRDALALEYPDIAMMDDQLVAYMNSQPEFMQKLQQYARGGPGFTQEETREYLLKAYHQISGQYGRSQPAPQTPQQQTPPQPQQPPVQQQVPPQQPQMPLVDEFGRPVPQQAPQQPPMQQQAPPQPQQPAPPPGQVPGQGIDPNYAARMAAQGMDRSQQIQPAPDQPMSPEELLFRQRWVGYY